MIPIGQKFACLAFRLFRPTPEAPLPADLGNGFNVRVDLPVDVTTFWRDALGSLKAEQIAEADFVVVASAEAPDVYVLDSANHHLTQRVQYLHWAITISAGVCAYDFANLLTGGHGIDGLRIRSVMTPEKIEGTLDNFAHSVTTEQLREASSIAIGIELIHQAGTYSGPYWRMMSGFDAFLTGLKSHRAYVRLHQFVRAIESFLPPSAVGAQAFAGHLGSLIAGTRAEDDPAIADVLREMYMLRNAAEHHRGLSYGRPFVDEERRVFTANRRLRQAETLVRDLYRRWFRMPAEVRDLWRSEDTVEEFWRRRTDVRLAFWGVEHGPVLGT